MDISVLLALDTAAFQQGLKAATDALGQFKAGADVCFEALGKAQAQIDAAADAAAKEAAKVTEAAEAARAQAQAEREAAKAATEAASAAEEHADKSENLGEALGKAKGAMGAMSGAAAALRGDFQGVASGTMQASQGLRALGVSMQTVERASVALAAVGAVIAAVAAAAKVLRERAESLESIRLDNLAAGAERAAGHFERLAGIMERAAGLARSLDDAAASGKRLEQERKLAELERDRNRELASGGDADEVNRRYDARKRELEFSFRREEAGDAVAGLERDRAANAERRAALTAEMNDLRNRAESYRAEAQEAYGKGRAGLLGRLARGDVLNQSNQEFAAKGDALSAKANELGEKAVRLAEQLQALENEDKVLAANLGVARGRAGLVDIQEEAASLAARAVERQKDEPGGGARDPATGGWGAMQTASDRLARIGGFVGGGYARQNEAREQVRIARESQRYLAQIAENTRSTGTGVLA